MRRARLVWVVLVLAACASYRPQPIETVPFQERAKTQTVGKVKVTAAVLSDEESHAVFGVKVLLALHVLGMLFLVSAPPQDDPGAEAKRSRLLTGAAVSALLIFALAAYLKFLHA